MDIENDDNIDEWGEAGKIMARKSRNHSAALSQNINISDDFRLRKVSALMTMKERICTISLFIGIAITMGVLAAYQLSIQQGMEILALEIIFFIALISTWVHVKKA